MNRLMLCVMMLVGAVCAGGCQTISHGTTQVVTITSEPSGATVEIPGFGIKTTPAFFILPRTQGQTVWVTKEGYKPQQFTLVAQLVPSRATPEVGVMSVLGSVVDVAAGGSWEIAPDKLNVALVANTPAASTPVVATAEVKKTEPVPSTAPSANAKVVVNPATPPIVANEAVKTAPAPVVVPSSASPEAKAALEYNLARLEHLYKEGLISKDEYELLKNSILAGGSLAGVGTP